MEDSVKRGSDSLLESKLKERITKPRSLQNRYVRPGLVPHPDSHSHAQGPKSGPHLTHLGRASSIFDPHDQRDDPLGFSHRLFDYTFKPDERYDSFVPVG